MAAIKILVGSVYGGSVEVAEKAQELAQQRGHQVELSEDPDLGFIQGDASLLVVTSTTGSGDLPDGLQAFSQQLESQPVSLAGRSYAVIALGDASYGDSFCAAGKNLDAQLADLGAEPLLPMLTIDALEYFEPVEGAGEWIESWLSKLP
ncbi:flavodoxin domain-containing protein [Marinospirillum perlucidum]|uniref:flavodoxin domain-containing protein n=1 Tax=Marinospirillum perlucidum TaxID=1982602 RepID=UPI000DF427C0|nr:flavodoxin domain-containing protein [Marinospirillum perlucidum]